MSWHFGRLAAFDLETTSVDPETARIVTAAVTVIRPQRTAHAADDPARWLTIDRYGWIADPGVEIPAGAAALHGFTTERARAEGKPAHRVVHEVSIVLGDLIAGRVPLVIMNAPYDLTLLDRELERHHLPSLAERTAGAESLVIDPYVLDQEVDRWRPGRRNLTTLCEVYGVTLRGAHEAAADALAAAKVAAAIAQAHPSVRLPLPELHKRQIEWAAEQADSLREYLAAKGRDASTVHGHWPMIPRQGGTS